MRQYLDLPTMNISTLEDHCLWLNYTQRQFVHRSQPASLTAAAKTLLVSRIYVDSLTVKTLFPRAVLFVFNNNFSGIKCH